MAVFVVAYNLTDDAPRPMLMEELKRCRAWAKLADDSYVVETDETAEEVSDRFDRHLSRADDLYVITPNVPYSTFAQLFGFSPAHGAERQRPRSSWLGRSFLRI